MSSCFVCCNLVTEVFTCGGTLALCLVPSPLDQAIQVQALSRELCCVLGQDNLISTVPL